MGSRLIRLTALTAIATFALAAGASADGLKFVRTWGGEGDDPGEFNSPLGIATDADGNVYVGDTGNTRIQKFDSNGNFITDWGSGRVGSTA